MAEDAKEHERHVWLKLLRATALCRKCEEPCFETDPELLQEFFLEHAKHNVRS